MVEKLQQISHSANTYTKGAKFVSKNKILDTIKTETIHNAPALMRQHLKGLEKATNNAYKYNRSPIIFG